MVTRKDYDIVKADNRESGGRTEVTNGNDDAWRQLWDLTEALANDPVGNADNYFTVQGLNPDGTRNPSLPVLLDVDNLIDYSIIIFFTGGRDSGLSWYLGNNAGNNWFGLRNRLSNDVGFQFFIHDNEHSLGANNTDAEDRTGPFFTSNQDNYEYSNPGYMHQDMLVSPEYRQRFIDRVQKHFFNGGVLTEQANFDRINARIAQVDPAIIAESARWGDSKTSNPKTKATWENEIDSIFDTFFPLRTTRVLNQLRADGLWTDVPAPGFSPEVGSIPAGNPIFLTVPNGEVYYTLDGSDPRDIGGGLNPNATEYFLPIFISEDTTIRARTLLNGEWSPMVEGTFTIEGSAADATNTRITEIHYHPSSPTAAELALAPNTSGGDYEFIEVTNIGNEPIDINEIRFSDGILHTSMPGSVAAGESVVFVSNPTAFQARYGADVEYHGVYGPLTGLANSGESISLLAADGSTIQSFTFDDADNWPSLADGSGPSLRVIDVNGDYDDPLNWLPSSSVHGTPGIHEAPITSSQSIRITEFNYNPGGAGAEFVELLNIGSTVVDLQGFGFVEGITFEFPDASSSLIEPNERVVIAQSISDFVAAYGNDIPVAGQFAAGSLSNGGERLILFDNAGDVVHDFVYDDVAPWSPLADGLGRSLEIVDMEGNYSDGTNWTASDVVGGTPGSGDTAMPGDFNGDGSLDCADINSLTTEAASGNNSSSFDLDGDGLVNSS